MYQRCAVFALLASGAGVGCGSDGRLLALGEQRSGLSASIRIGDAISFHRATLGQRFGVLEDAETDTGGVLTFFVHNQSVATDAITRVQFIAGGTVHTPLGYRVWPPAMAGLGQGTSVTAITVKSTDYPFREGDALSLEVWSQNGGYDRWTTTVNVTPEIRLANVIPDRDGALLYLYLRNDGAVPYDIERVQLNGAEYLVGDPALTVLGFTPTLQPGHVAILRLRPPTPLPPGAPMAIGVRSRRQTDGAFFWTSAGLRQVAPEFPIGTWFSSALDPVDVTGRQRLRELSLSGVVGPGAPGQLQAGLDQFHIKSMFEPFFGDPFDPNVGAANVRPYAGAPYLQAWMVEDEPDLGGKPVGIELAKNQTLWQTDPTTPTYVNLAGQKRFQKYGWFTDIVSMDHYAAPDAPNIIPWTWVDAIGRTGEIEESIEYTRQLKLNTEPRRMWSWSQLVAGWGQQPRDDAINYQFWAHIMEGAKGLFFFLARPDTEQESPSAWAEARQVTRELNTVRNLVLYGEPFDGVNSAGDVTSGALVGPDAMVLVVVNNALHFRWQTFAWKWSTHTDDPPYAIEFHVPDWIPVEQAYRVTDYGRDFNIGFTHLGGRRFRIDPPYPIYKDSHVFVVGRVDTEPPSAPTLRQINGDVLSWSVPADNYGVLGYRVYRDGIEVAQSPTPVMAIDLPGHYTVRAYDAAGNLGAPSNNVVRTRGRPVRCSVFNDGYADMSAPADAITTPRDNRACVPGGTCRRWLGRCATEPDVNGHTHPVVFKVFDDGYTNSTAGYDAVFVRDANRVCVPGSGLCRRWFGLGTALTRDGHRHGVKCHLFDDGYRNMTSATDAILWDGSRFCRPGATVAECRQWFGRCFTD